MKLFFVTFLILLSSSFLVAQHQLFKGRLTESATQSKISENSLNRNTDLYEREAKFLADIKASRVDSLILSSFGDTILYRFSYDSRGGVTAYYCYLKRNSVWTNSSRKLFSYTADGKVGSITSEKWTNNSWIGNTRLSYTYNSAGLVNTIMEERWSNSSWGKYYLTTNEYNAMGLISILVVQKWMNSSWVNYQKYEREYNKWGDFTLNFYQEWTNGTWTPVTKYSFTYTDWGAIKMQLTEYFASNGSKSGYQDTYTYNSDKLVTIELTESGADTVWKPYSKLLHNYESNNLVDKSYYLKWRDTVWVNNTMYIDSLSADKLILNRITGSWSNGQWVIKKRTVTATNSAGNLLSVITDKYSNNVWVDYSRESYTYDPSGTILQAFKINEWYNGTPSDVAKILDLNIDSNYLTVVNVTAGDLRLWYTNVVPVELASFAGSYENGNVLLKWNTATETNNRGFEVERKTGNSDWKGVCFVNGAGTTTKPCNYAFEDKNVPEGKLYYRLKQIDLDGTFSYQKQIEITASVIKDFSLAQNYPNPFNPSTVINFTLPFESKVKVNIYNTTGQLVKELVNGVKEAGAYNVKFDASQLSSGVYFYTIEASQLNGKNSFSNTKKMILVK